MVRKTRRLFLLCVFFITAICSTIIVKASELSTESVESEKKVIVFLLDASGSMKLNDPDRLAIDSIAQLIYSLPSNYMTAIVAYNDQVVCSTELTDSPGRNSAIQKISSVSYTGYTNAGDALARASEILKETDASEKTVVILSDGEIDMKTLEETTRSSEVFQTAVSNIAEQGNKIHVMGLGSDLRDTDINIFSAAERTGGIRMELLHAKDIPGAIEKILVEQLHIRKSTGAIIDASGGIDSVSVDLPFQTAEKVRILLTSTGKIQNLITDFHAAEAKQTNGMYYSFVEITNPSAGTINFQLQGEPGSQIKVDILPEYTVSAKPESIDLDIDSEAEFNKSFRIRFYDAQNQNRQLFTESIFDNSQIKVTINEKEFLTAINGGDLLLDFLVEESQLISFQFDFKEFPANILGSVRTSLEVEVIEEQPPEPDIRPWIIVGATVIILLTALIIALRHRSKKVITMAKEEQTAASKNSYSGNLSFYITRTASGYDIPPLSFNLFRLSSGQEISLRKILDMCGVDEILEGAEKILFQPGANRSLILTNQSDCTILRNREILMKGKSYGLPLNAKVDISFEDERSELAFQYKEAR